MTRKLKLYSNVQPNKGEEIHLMPNSINSYLNYLSINLIKQVDFPNYRINNGRVLLKISEDFPLHASQIVTYIIDTDEDEYMRCYFVTRIYDESGFIVFEVELDNWGTYIRNASFPIVHVSRCNRDIGNGVYDAVARTKGCTLPIHLKPYDLQLYQCSIVFLLEYNVSENLFGSNQITKTSLFAIDLQRIYDIVHDVAAEFDNLDIIQKAIDMVGGIHSVGGTNSVIGTQLAAHVLKAWLVPSDTLIFTDLGAYQINTKCLMTKGAEVGINHVFIVQAINSIIEKDMKDLLQDPAANWAEFLPDYHIEVGTLYRAMSIVRFTRETKAYFHFVYTNIGVKVYVEQGLQQEDITESFEVSITTNNATETSLMTATKSLAMLASGVAALAKGYAKGGTAGAAAAAGLYGIGLLGNVKDAQPLQAIGSGDGALTFWNGRKDSVNNPYYLMLTPSNESEKEHAYYFGVQYNLYNNQFAAIEAAPQLGVPHGIMKNDGFYILADEVEISGLPKEAGDFVRGEFARGIWLHVLK